MVSLDDLAARYPDDIELFKDMAKELEEKGHLVKVEEIN